MYPRGTGYNFFLAREKRIKREAEEATKDKKHIRYNFGGRVLVDNGNLSVRLLVLFFVCGGGGGVLASGVIYLHICVRRFHIHKSIRISTCTDRIN